MFSTLSASLASSSLQTKKRGAALDFAVGAGDAPVVATYDAHQVFMFRANATVTVNNPQGKAMHVAVVGGGGGGGPNTKGGGTGGGGGGQVRYFTVPSGAVLTDTLTVTVGKGGVGVAGSPSTVAFATNSNYTLTSVGGGAGADYSLASADVATDKGNSGGSSLDLPYFRPTKFYGTGKYCGGIGGVRGGGGGAGAGGAGYGCGGYTNNIVYPNGDATKCYENSSSGATNTRPLSDGGDGINIPLPGFNPLWFFGGGGGGSAPFGSNPPLGYNPGNGGKGGGGMGGKQMNGTAVSSSDVTYTGYSPQLATQATSQAGGNGAANSGGGGGGGWANVNGSGGSGIVIITVA